MDNDTEMMTAVEVTGYGVSTKDDTKQIVTKVAAVSESNIPEMLVEVLGRINIDDFQYIVDIHIRAWELTREEAREFAERVKAEHPDAPYQGEL